MARHDALHSLAVGVPDIGVGTETFIRRYCEELNPGYTSVVACSDRAQWTFDGPKFILDRAFVGQPAVWRLWRAFQKCLLVASRFGDPYTIRRARAFLRCNQVSAVFSQYLVFGWSLLDLCRKSNVRHVVRGHGFDVSQCLDDPRWRKRYRSFAGACTIVVPTEYQKRRLVDIGICPDQIVCIPCGVIIPTAPFEKDITPSGSDTIQCLAVGRLVPKKAPKELLSAFFYAAAFDERLHLTIVGDGPLREAVSQMIRASPFGNRVALLGARPHSEVHSLLKSADIFLQHSVTDAQNGDQEGAPVAIMEALAHRVPVISTKHSGIPYLVDDGVSGFLVPEMDWRGMGEQILALSRCPLQRRAFGEMGLMRAKRDFTWEREKELLLQLLFDPQV